MKKGWIPALALLLAITTLPALGESLDDLEKRVAAREFHAAVVLATQLIEKGNLQTSALARVHLLRGIANNKRFKGANAFADFQAAHALAPENPEAWYWLGYAHAYGYSGRQDREQALKLLKQASQSGNGEADLQIAYLMQATPEDPEGMSALRRAADANVIAAINTLARMNSYGQVLPRNPQRAAELFRRSAHLGDAEGQYQLAAAYYDGYGVEKDVVVARSWLDKAIAQDNAGAHLRMGNLLEGGEDVRATQYHYWLAAEGGLPGGMVNIGLAYLRGRGVSQDWRHALTWLHRAQGVPMADFYLGLMYLYGLGIEPNDKVAFDAFQRSAAMSSSKALLAAMYQAGLGTQQNSARAQQLVDELIAGNDARSLNEAAWILATSERADFRQPALALRLATKSVELGADAMNLDTLAAAYAASGDFDKACDVQGRALSAAPTESRDGMAARLSSFKERKAWTQPLQPEVTSAPPAEPKLRHVATFTGEVIQLWQGYPSPRTPGYAVDAAAVFGLRILIQKVDRGALPQVMQDTAVFFIHSPTDFFAPLRERIPLLSTPEGPRRFVLTEREANGWMFQLDIEPLRIDRAGAADEQSQAGQARTSRRTSRTPTECKFERGRPPPRLS